MYRKLAFRPVIFDTLKNYSKEKFISALVAGINVGIVALPLSIAFGTASGVSPEKGIITAIVAGFIGSMLGGCSIQITGPTGALIVTVFGIIAQFGMEGLAIATFMGGIMLILMGLLRMGTVIKIIPYPIVVGFTSGIALSIFTSQVKDFLGLTLDENPVDFVSKWIAIFRNIETINPAPLIVSIITILFIKLSPKVSKKIPGALIAIIVMSAVVFALREYAGFTGIETIGDRFVIDTSIPAPHMLTLNMETINQLFPTAFTIAILGAIVSLLSATVADGMIGQKHDANTELVAQGVANLFTPLFGGIPATGAVARTITNINNGGRTPIAGMIHAVVLLVILVVLGSLTKYIPMACLAGILVVVSYNMSEWRTFRSLMKNPKSEAAVLITTFILTVVFSLTIAIEVGLLLAMVLFLRRVAETTKISVFTDQLSLSDESELYGDNDTLSLPTGVEVYEIEGPFFFGVASKFDEYTKVVGDKPKIRIIRMRRVPFIDSTGVRNLELFVRLSKEEKIDIILSGVNSKVRDVLIRSGFAAKLGEENICDNITLAIERSREMLKTKH